MSTEFGDCPFCHNKLKIGDLQRHVNKHLDEEDLANEQVVAFHPSSSSASHIGHAADLGQQSRDAATFKRAVDPCSSSTSQSNDTSRGGSKAIFHNNYSTQKRYYHILETQEVEAMLVSQLRASFVKVKEGLIFLLRKCLEAENQGISQFALSGYVDHFQSQDGEDAGWGCGWRNIQMLSSNLLSKDPNAKDTLFGGAGFVPNIEALQQWLEIAWARGFDPPGANHFGWKIHGTSKWIGTTECASLLRSFGLRARVIDFAPGNHGIAGNNQSSSDKKSHLGYSSRNVLQSINQNSLSSDTVHWDVECDNCGIFPIRGPRFKSTNMDNYDLCASCVAHLSSLSGTEEFLDLVWIEKPTDTTVAVKDSERKTYEHHQRVKSEISHQQLVDWVWQYFATSNVNSHKNLDHSASCLTRSERPPLYFQHQGHSRTIVGIQRQRKSMSAPEEVFLLILDPSQKTENLARALREDRGWQRLLKRGVHTLLKAEYQLCYVDPGIAVDSEFEQLKAIGSVPYYY